MSADPTCTVVRKCSSTGVACGATDRACQSDATTRGLEVICESDGSFVYCPPNTGHADSNVVWLLLLVAIAIAVTGGSVAWVVLRKKPS